MSYRPYIFRIPRNTPDLDYATLNTWMGLRGQRKIGATVTVVALDAHASAMGEVPASFEFWLYETLIARVYPDRVDFPGPDDPHMATTEWIAKIVHDNAIGGWVGRIRRIKADGPGPEVPRGRAGLLVIGGRDRPVYGRAYPVSREAIEDQRRKHAEWQAKAAEHQKQFAEESRRREALKTWEGPEGTFYASDDGGRMRGSYWRVMDATFRDGGADYATVGYVFDTRPGQGASPYPDGVAWFEAFAGADQLTTRSLGKFVTLAGALQAVAQQERPVAVTA